MCVCLCVYYIDTPLRYIYSCISLTQFYKVAGVVSPTCQHSSEHFKFMATSRHRQIFSSCISNVDARCDHYVGLNLTLVYEVHVICFYV